MSGTVGACRELELAIMAFVDGELPRDEEEAVLAHLAQCAACREDFEAQAALRDSLVASAAGDGAPASLRHGLDQAIAQADRVLDLTARRRRLNHWLIPGSATALAAAAIALAVVGARPAPSPPVAELASTTVAAEAARQLVRAAPLEVKGAAATPAWVQRHFDAGLMLPASAEAPPRNASAIDAGAAPPRAYADAIPAMKPLRGAADATVRLQGARLSAFRGRDAILLQYEVDTAAGVRAMQVLAFSAHDMAWGRLVKTVRGGRELYLDEHLGVRAVATVDHGYAYVFASSAMSHEELADVVLRMNWCQVRAGAPGGC